MQNEPIEVTLLVTTVLEKLGIPYLIGGSLASILHGMVRTTQDSGIITEMRLEHIRSFISSLENDFFVDEDMILMRFSETQASIFSTETQCSRWMSSSRHRAHSKSRN